MKINNKENFFFKIKTDFNANLAYTNPKPLIIVLSYRIASYFALNDLKIIKIIGFPIRILYRIFIEWILGVEIPDGVKSGGGLTVHHGVGLVLHPTVVLGKNVILRQNTTIGHKTDINGISMGAPTIGDNVDIGANVVIIGGISVGDNSIIGAGTIVVKDVPSNSTVVGNPAKIIKYNNF